jgi:multidrug resistance efflux pump
LAHRYGDEQPPKRPSQEVMTARAQAEFERACERHVEMLVQFMDYEELKKERDEARAEVAKHQASKFHPDWSLLQTCREELEEARAEAETLRAAIDGEP